ncbi:MAG: 6-carboxytetrahydropterin synthase QueD [Candidatus Marinimicrobia bacterium]|jgi:6-pyruvoyltetrahydropterin/6-carboxytetrahydropterin synthase|nr:6-carboxytetrahydropterin synthase QueD [Candidatus Neomarinimicrobiota bacterium]HJL75363.1 6-carboxytetrahydropterin synthase QueD [Candidatus Neomarinimicrobiota bacterium]|tara:strand:- start:763 stop:1116 length:354 start_codon:yes stop_codon:yes gene_type:complete
MQLYKKFSFDSAHYLPNLPDGHKCKRMHGHTFYVKIYIDGPIDSKIGWIMDFAEIKEIFNPILKQLDHRILNDIEGLENPTSENLAIWIWDKIKPLLPLLSQVIVSENCTTGCIYKG